MSADRRNAAPAVFRRRLTCRRSRTRSCGFKADIRSYSRSCTIWCPRRCRGAVVGLKAQRQLTRMRRLRIPVNLILKQYVFTPLRLASGWLEHRVDSLNRGQKNQWYTCSMNGFDLRYIDSRRDLETAVGSALLASQLRTSIQP